MITASGLIQLGFKPDIDFRVEDHGSGAFISQWNSPTPQPSEAEIEAASSEYDANWSSKEYSRNREEEYPSIDELIVALWENVVEERAASVIALEAKRQEIKAKYPK